MKLLRYLFARSTGLKDVSGRMIREHDRVCGYEAKWPATLVAHAVDGAATLVAHAVDGAAIYELDCSEKPKFVDVPLFEGRVAWDGEGLRWTVCVTWLCKAWEGSGAASVGMGGRAYVFEIL